MLGNYIGLSMTGEPHPRQDPYGATQLDLISPPDLRIHHHSGPRGRDGLEAQVLSPVTSSHHDAVEHVSRCLAIFLADSVCKGEQLPRETCPH